MPHVAQDILVLHRGLPSTFRVQITDALGGLTGLLPIMDLETRGGSALLTDVELVEESDGWYVAELGTEVYDVIFEGQWLRSFVRFTDPQGNDATVRYQVLVVPAA
jgi:hypothetical protein